MFLFGDGSKKDVFPEGDHSLPFVFQLPSDLPTSFEGKHGSIKYYVKATILRCTLQSDDHSETHFTIINNVDINNIPNGEVVWQHTFARVFIEFLITFYNADQADGRQS